ncbi:MAG TPA: hypothetical protein VK941_02450 [Gillisia sp.]|nr:hypothetical protein [Gillisia sp.]
MSKESDKSSPVPTPHDKEHSRNQSTEVERNKPNIKMLAIVVGIIIVLVIIAAFSGFLDF